MARLGRDRKAKPRAVWGAYPDSEKPGNPQPRKSETFASFRARLEGGRDPLLRMLIELGYDEPSQSEYLLRLHGVREVLHRLDFALHTLWPAYKQSNTETP